MQLPIEALSLRIVSSTFLIVQILVHSHFDLVSWFLALEATGYSNGSCTDKHSSQQKEMSVKATFFFM